MRKDLLIVTCIICLLAGCIVVPLPNTTISGTPITTEHIKLLSAADATREDVIASMGEPEIIWEEADLYIYQWGIREGLILVCAGFSCAGGPVENHYLLLVQFNHDNLIVRAEVTNTPEKSSFGDFLKKWIARPQKKQLLIPPEIEERIISFSHSRQ